MRSLRDLAESLSGLDGRGYRAYKQIAGAYSAGDFQLHIDHVQGDPFAEPITTPQGTFDYGDRCIDRPPGRRATSHPQSQPLPPA